jgi:hypothetical protein
MGRHGCLRQKIVDNTSSIVAGGGIKWYQVGVGGRAVKDVQ